jgi:hypothetical protein
VRTIVVRRGQVHRSRSSPPLSVFTLSSLDTHPSSLTIPPSSGMPSTSSPWQKPSRFKEHLSISPSDNFDIEQSRFSPDSVHLHPLRTASLTLAGSPQSLKTARDIPEDVESLRSHGSSSNAQRQTIRDRFTKIFFDVRTLDDRSNNQDSDLVSVRPMSPWAPLNVDKKEKSPLPTSYPAPCYLPPQKKQKKKRFRWCTILLILIILALLGNLAFLNVRVVELTKIIHGNGSSTPTPTSSNSSINAVQQCASEFTINAPSNPSAYPCSTCLPILANVTNNSVAANAVQFCGLLAILESTSTTGQTALSNGRWGKDLNVCAWSGVSCSSSGLVTSL